MIDLRRRVEEQHALESELCEAYGIARETGYVWLRRYQERGLAGLVELNRAALRHGNQTPKFWMGAFRFNYGATRLQHTLASPG